MGIIAEHEDCRATLWSLSREEGVELEGEEVEQTSGSWSSQRLTFGRRDYPLESGVHSPATHNERCSWHPRMAHSKRTGLKQKVLRNYGKTRSYPGVVGMENGAVKKNLQFLQSLAS